MAVGTPKYRFEQYANDLSEHNRILTYVPVALAVLRAFSLDDGSI
jgi:hypothetical protein